MTDKDNKRCLVNLRETLNPKQSWNSSMSRFRRVLFPLPDGPAMTSGAGAMPYWLLAVLFQRTRSGEKEERRLKAGAQRLLGSLPVLAARTRGRLAAGRRLLCNFSFWVPMESIFSERWSKRWGDKNEAREGTDSTLVEGRGKEGAEKVAKRKCNQENATRRLRDCRSELVGAMAATIT